MYLVSSFRLISHSYCMTNIQTGLTKNPCITADELSEKSGFDVYVPDLFHGDPIPSSFLKSMPDAPGEHMSIGTKVNFR